MSKRSKEKLICSKCGKEGEFVVWHSLNAMLNPYEKKVLMDGNLFKYTCPHCGAVSTVVYDFLYHQMEDQTMIQLATSEEAVPQSIEVFASLMDGELMPGISKMNADYRLRIVKSQNSLREKIYIFDQGLDDRVIELMKVAMIAHIAETQPEFDIQEIFLEIGEARPKNFAILLVGGTWASMKFPQGLYNDLRDAFITPGDDGKREYFVNRDWALEQFKARKKE